MTLLVHLLQYRLHHSKLNYTDTKIMADNDKIIYLEVMNPAIQSSGHHHLVIYWTGFPKWVWSTTPLLYRHKLYMYCITSLSHTCTRTLDCLSQVISSSFFRYNMLVYLSSSDVVISV